MLRHFPERGQMSRTNRLFDLLGILRASRMPVSAVHLADELAVSQRSIYRDIETLRSMGAPLEGQAGVGYQLRGGFFLPPLAFSVEEMDALILGLDWVRKRADPALARSSDSALAKVLSARNKQAQAGPGSSGVLTSASAAEHADPPYASQLRDAIHQQLKIEIGYADAQGSPSMRTIWPIAIVYFDDVRILAAWCEQRAAFRHFRLDRLTLEKTSNEQYPERRQVLMKRWVAQDRDWPSMLTLSGTASD